MNSVTSWILGRVYTKKTMAGAGAIKGDKGDKGDAGTSLQSYGFTKVPKAFLVGTYVNTAIITVLTTTQMKVQMVNVYSSARSDMKAQYHLIEFE